MAITKRETVNLRIKTEERNLIDRAALVRGKDRANQRLRKTMQTKPPWKEA